MIENLKYLFSSFAFLIISFQALATNPEGEKDSTKVKTIIDLAEVDFKDNPILANIDSLLNLNLFVQQSDYQSTNQFLNLNIDSLLASPVVVDDETLKTRLEALNASTPLELVYNEKVKNYINLYANSRREQVSRMLGLANYYFPLFEEKLDKYDIPLEIKYLAVVESALNPTAKSRVGATGLWQFMYSTGKLQGLKVSSYVDERTHPIKSTEAACKYLKSLHNIFGDWNLALAAYNSGPGNVSKAIRRSGGKKDYWAIRPFLPRETAGYVPAFIAVNYIMNHAEDHLIYPTEIKPSFYQVDTIVVKEKVSFDQISKLLEIEKSDLEFLNPSYKHHIIPKVNGSAYELVLPKEKIGLFVSHEDSIYQLIKDDFSKNKKPEPTYVEMNELIYHRVRSGEYLGLIAEKYGVGVSSIRRWNGLRGNTIRIGQRLKIYPRRMPGSTSSVVASKASHEQPSNSSDYVFYKVHSGESFYSIAKKYPGISAENIMGWNNYRSAKSLKPGVSLKIYTKS